MTLINIFENYLCFLLLCIELNRN